MCIVYLLMMHLRSLYQSLSPMSNKAKHRPKGRCFCFLLLLAPVFLRAESVMILRTFSSFSFNKIGEVGNQLTRKINMSIY